jgi:hypothetical protein
VGPGWGEVIGSLRLLPSEGINVVSCGTLINSQERIVIKEQNLPLPVSVGGEASAELVPRCLNFYLQNCELDKPLPIRSTPMENGFIQLSKGVTFVFDKSICRI